MLAMKPAIPQKKVELHLHLDGSIRHSTAWELIQQKGIQTPGVTNFEEFKKACIVSNPSNLWGFLQHFNIFSPAIEGDLDAIERVAYELCEDLKEAGVVYAEARYSPHSLVGPNILQQVGNQALDEVILRVSHGLSRGEHDFGVKVRTILCAHYTKEYNELRETLRLCQHHHSDGVVGIDLLTVQPEHGIVDEAPVVEPIVSVYEEAAQTGVHRTIHAAEASSAQAVYRAIYLLGSERVGHGYHVVQDEQLYHRCLRDRDRVHFECCPYSSLMTGSVNKGGEDHPIMRFARDGANFSISSDDPTVTGNYVSADYDMLASWGMTTQQMLEANINAASSCFLGEQEKNLLVREMKQCLIASNNGCNLL